MQSAFRFVVNTLLVIVSSVLPAAEPATWKPNSDHQAALAKKNTKWRYREEDVPKYQLPEPLVTKAGRPITSAAEWETIRRAETLELFATHVYGRTPAKPAKITYEVVTNDATALEGRATLRVVKITSIDAAGKSFTFSAAVLTPNARSKPVPAFILINNRGVKDADPTRAAKDGFWPAEAIIARGYATAVFRTNDVDPDNKDEAQRALGVRGVWPAGGGTVGSDAWGTIGAWAWGASRVLDYLETLPEIDAKKVGVVGHSRGGKTALWAGAQDERFAITVSNDSGRGGASLSRRRFGETVQVINTVFPHWFCANFKKYNEREDEVPVDQHQLMSLIAPRGLYVASADADLWADPRGEFSSLALASPVFALYQAPTITVQEMPPLDRPLMRGPRGYHVRTGTHNLTPYDWERFMDFGELRYAK